MSAFSHTAGSTSLEERGGAVLSERGLRPRVQSGARRDGIAGIYGIPGNVESATYRIYRVVAGSNPTLSANNSF
jgi:hypothetical protein